MPEKSTFEEKATEIRKRGDPIPVPRPSPGNNNELPNPNPSDSEDLDGETRRDVSNEGVQADPKSGPLA